MEEETSKVDRPGYSLKKRSIKRWIYAHGYTQRYIARRLGMSPKVFKKKLCEREKFNEEQIERLVDLMKARWAFRVLYFPTKKQRRRVYREVFSRGGRRNE